MIQGLFGEVKTKNEMKCDQGLGPKDKELFKKEFIPKLGTLHFSTTCTIDDLEQKCRVNDVECRVSSMGNCALETLK